MKTLSSFNQTAIDDPNVNVIYLCEIEFSGLTLYLCDRVFGGPGSEFVWQSNIYQPIILSYDTINTGKINPTTFETEPSETSFIVDNTIPIGGADKFTSLFTDYTPQYATVTISMIFSGASAAGDKIDLFKGKIEDILNMQQDTIQVSCSAYELDLTNKFAHEILDAATYPNADPDDIGKMLPQVWGTAKKVPCIAADVGVLTTISEDITSGSTTVKLTDASNMGASGIIIVDNEQIAYSGKAGDSLTGCTRAQNGTTATSHNKGASVGEIRSEYDYILGCAVKAIDDVYVANVKQEAGVYTAYTGQTGDEHPTYTGRAVIKFDTWPQIKREVDLSGTSSEPNAYREATNVPIGRVKALDKSGMVLDYDTRNSITFQTAPTGSLSNIYVEYNFEFRHFGTIEQDYEFKLDGKLIAAWKGGEFYQFVTSPLKVSKAAWPTSAGKSKSFRDGNNTGTAFTVLSATVYARSDVSDFAVRGSNKSLEATNIPIGQASDFETVDASTTITFPAQPAGTLSDIEYTYSWDFKSLGDPIFTGSGRHMTIDGVNVAWVDTDGSVTALMPSTFKVLKSAWETSTIKLKSVLDEWGRGQMLVIRSASASYFTDSDIGNITLTGNSMADSIIGGSVSVDIQGYQDDAVGTYTGTPNALIDRPDWICKHILIDRCGLAASDVDSAGSYATSGTYYDNKSFTLAPVILEPPSPRSLLQRIAYQSRSLQFWEAGVHHLVYIPDGGEILKTIPSTRIDIGQLWVQYTQRVDIQNTLTSQYARDWSGYSDNIEADQSIVTATDADSVAKYGTLYGTYNLNYVTTSTMAQRVLDWILRIKDNPRLLIEMAGGYYFTDIERGDVIRFDDGLDDDLIWQDTAEITWQDRTDISWSDFILGNVDGTYTDEQVYMQNTLLGLVDYSKKFRVIDKIYRSDASQQLQIVEIT